MSENEKPSETNELGKFLSSPETKEQPVVIHNERSWEEIGLVVGGMVALFAKLRIKMQEGFDKVFYGKDMIESPNEPIPAPVQSDVVDLPVSEITVLGSNGDPFAGLEPIASLIRISNKGTGSTQMKNTRIENPIVAQYFEAGTLAGLDGVAIAKRLIPLGIPRSILACFVFQNSRNAGAADKRLERALKK